MRCGNFNNHFHVYTYFGLRSLCNNSYSKEQTDRNVYLIIFQMQYVSLFS